MYFTRNGLIGFSPRSMHPEDAIAILYDLDMPVVIRRSHKSDEVRLLE
jgi:hypothetical protein